MGSHIYIKKAVLKGQLFYILHEYITPSFLHCC